jgi:hypothetical protein
MSKQVVGNTGDNSDDDGSYFAWEFVNDESKGHELTRPSSPAAGGPVPLNNIRLSDLKASEKSLQHRDDATKAEPSQNKGKPPAENSANTRYSQARVNYIGDQLDKALDRWWAYGELPPLPLLRDALLMLEGGGTTSESQRTLLFRTALAYNRGIQTALRYQVDNERVAFVLAEALVEWEPPLESERLPTILGHDSRLRSLLRTELERSRILATGEPRQRAENALAALTEMISPTHSARISAPPIAQNRAQGGRRIRQVLFILLVIATVAFVVWNLRQTTPSSMVEMPAADYAMIRETGVESVHLQAFLIDRFEVTNLEYRACVNAGKCSWPLRTSSATRSDYFTNPAFNGYPVIQVTQAMSQDYCVWMETRLPTAAEWQAAASVSPITGQAVLYPWGESFDPQRANSGVSGIGDTLAVGSYRPGGDSPSGAVDMAGNVAEWTSTETAAQGTGSVIVKGGSFLDEPAELSVAAQREVAATQAASDVGFRCARAKSVTRS